MNRLKFEKLCVGIVMILIAIMVTVASISVLFSLVTWISRILIILIVAGIGYYVGNTKLFKDDFKDSKNE